MRSARRSTTSAARSGFSRSLRATTCTAFTACSRPCTSDSTMPKNTPMRNTPITAAVT